MKNYLNDAEIISVITPSAVTSGQLVIIGHAFGVAVTDAAPGAYVSLVTEGAFTLPKKSTTVFAVGDLVSYDTTNAYCDAPGTGLYPIGYALTAAGNGVTSLQVKVNETSTSAA